MDDASIGSLVGVAIGWLLTTLVIGWRSFETDRRSVGKLLSQLLHVHDQLRTALASSESFKDNADGWESYEVLRQRLMSKHFLEPPEHLKSLDEAIVEIAGLYPVKSLELRGLLHLLLKAKAHKFTSSVKVREVYLRLLSVHEVGLEASEKELRKLILGLAVRHSLITYLQVRFRLWIRLRRRAAVDGFLAEFSAQTVGAIRNAKESAENARAEGSANHDYSETRGSPE